MIKDVITIVAIIIIPIVSVLIGQYLQNRSEKRKDKMEIFKSVMTFRYGWSKEGVEALNCIPIVFSESDSDKEVRDCWKEYYKWLCIQSPDEMQIKQFNDSLYRLLLCMAKDLGYKDIITWEDIQNPYIPLGMVQAINNNEMIQKGVASLVQTMMISQMPSSDSIQWCEETK